MSLFAEKIALVRLNQEIIERNQARFDVIQARIESRIFPISTPMELIGMIGILRANKPLLAMNDRLLLEAAQELSKDISDNLPK